MGDNQKVKKYILFLRDYAVNLNNKDKIYSNDVFELSKELNHFKQQVDSFNISGNLKEQIQKLNLNFSIKKKKKMSILHILVTIVFGPKFNRNTYAYYETGYLRKILNNFSLDLESLIHQIDQQLQ